MNSPFFSPTIGVLMPGVVHLVCLLLTDPGTAVAAPPLMYSLWLVFDAMPTLPATYEKRRSAELP